MKALRLKKTIRVVIALLIIMVMVLVAQVNQRQLDWIKADIEKSRQIKIVPPGDYLPGSVLGFDLLVADLLWLRAIQYLARYLDSRDALWLYEYLNAIVNLDPNYIWVYLKGGVTLSFFCNDPMLSNKLLLKGLDRFIYYKIPFYLAFNYFYHLGEFEKAATYMKIASERMRNPVVRRHYAELAARLYASVGRTQITVDFLKMMVDHMEDPRLKEELLYKYRIAVNERDLEVIDFAIERYLASQKSCPSSMDLLVKEGYLLEIPQDPFGQGYYINKDNCKAATYAAYETMKKVFIFKEEEMHERGD